MHKMSSSFLFLFNLHCLYCSMVLHGKVDVGKSNQRERERVKDTEKTLSHVTTEYMNSFNLTYAITQREMVKSFAPVFRIVPVFVVVSDE